jgi:hypothetical protein
MAETLSVADLLPNKFEPKRGYRWIMAVEGIDSFLISATARPTITIAQGEVKWINSYRKYAGKLSFGGISITLHDPIAPSGAQQVMEWIRTHYESVSGRAGYIDFYKRDIQIKLLDPVGTVIELWDIKGAFLTQANFGALQYSAGEEPLNVSLSIEFDNCVLQF